MTNVTLNIKSRITRHSDIKDGDQNNHKELRGNSHTAGSRKKLWEKNPITFSEINKSTGSLKQNQNAITDEYSENKIELLEIQECNRN